MQPGRCFVWVSNKYLQFNKDWSFQSLRTCITASVWNRWWGDYWTLVAMGKGRRVIAFWWKKLRGTNSNLLLIHTQGASGGEQQSILLISEGSAWAAPVIDAEGQLFVAGHSLQPPSGLVWLWECFLQGHLIEFVSGSGVLTNQAHTGHLQTGVKHQSKMGSGGWGTLNKAHYCAGVLESSSCLKIPGAQKRSCAVLGLLLGVQGCPSWAVRARGFVSVFWCLEHKDEIGSLIRYTRLG